MSNKALYNKICAQKKGELTLFMQPWWLDVVCQNWDVAIAKKGDEVTGAWAYPVEQKLGVTLLRSPLLTPYLGPQVFYPGGIKESNQDSFEYETVAELMKQLPDAKVWHLALQPGMKQAGLFKNNKLEPHVRQTFLLKLTDSEETLLANMKETTRRNVRVGSSEITISDEPQCLDELFRFQKNTLKKKGKSQGYPFEYLRKVMDACIANNAGALWVAKKGDEVQAIVWQVWDEKCSYYFMGGQNPETNSYRAMSFLLWHTIKEAKKRGNTVFDFEGSMDEGVERFFRSFGGNRTLYMVLHKNESVIWKLKLMVNG